jgi:hypothetical protein
VEFPLDREDVVVIIDALHRAHGKLDRIILLLGEDDEEEEDETDA